MRDRRADIAAVASPGTAGDEAKYVDVGLEGEARGIISLGSRWWLEGA